MGPVVMLHAEQDRRQLESLTEAGWRVALDPVWLGDPAVGIGDLHCRLLHVTQPLSLSASFSPAISVFLVFLHFLIVSLPGHSLLPLATPDLSGLL